jgi:outer membrane protein assembly factor BamB
MDGSLRITTSPPHPEPATLTALDENGRVLWSTTIDDFSHRATEGTSLVAPRGVSEHLTAIGSDGTPLWSL